MAEQVKGVSVSEKTVATLRAEIRGLKDEISQLILTDKDYQKEAEQLTAKQLELSRATEVTKGAVIGVENSYAQLVAQTNALRKEWRSVDVGSERFKELSKQINDNNNRLKEMDKTIGDNFRNVGNYTEGFLSAFHSLGTAFPSVQKGVLGVKSGFDMLGKTPVLALFTLLVNIITKVVATMKQSEEGTKALTSVMGALDGVLTLVTKAFEWVGKGIAWVIEKVTDLTAKWFKQNGVIEQNIQIQNDQIALEELHRKNLVESAKVENEISELRAKSADKIKYSAQERIKFLEQAVEKEKALTKMQIEEAQKEYDLIVLKNAQTKSGTRDLEAEAQAQAKVIRMQTEYNKKLREYNAQLTEAKKALKTETKAKNASKGGSGLIDMPSFDADVEAVEKELADIPVKANESMRKGLEEETAERLRYANIAVGTEQEKARQIYDIRQSALKEELSLLEEGLRNKIFVDDKVVEAERRVAQIKRDIAYNTAEYEAEQSKKATEKKTADQKKYVQVATAGAQAIGSIIGSIADMYEADSEKNAENAKKAKNLRIASATMDMLGGITTAIAGAFTTKTGPWDFVLAGIQAATILASGIANITKIKNTDVSGNSSSSAGVSVSAPAVVQQVPVTRTLTGVAEEEELNKSRRVYVVYDDIAKAGQKVAVTNDESTF